MNQPNEPIFRLYKAYKSAPNIMRADTSGAGSIPAAALQYCEAMRMASSFGWYIYPPKDISLLFDGQETFYHYDGQWIPVKSMNFNDEFRQNWNIHAPDHLKDYDPPFISELFVPGHIQIWSGYFVSTKKDWSTLIRPPVNCTHRSLISCYEGLVETDEFSPCPLFINFRVLKTDVEVFLSKERPLFQIQPIMRSAYQIKQDWIEVVDTSDNLLSKLDWNGVAGTIRKADKIEEHRPGKYATTRRKRSKNSEE